MFLSNDNTVQYVSLAVSEVLSILAISVLLLFFILMMLQVASVSERHIMCH